MLICCEDQQKGLFGCHGFKNQVPWRPRDLMTMPLCQSMPIHGTMPGYVLSLLLLLSLLSGQIHGVKSNPASTASCYLRSCTSWFRQLDVTTVCEVVFRCFFCAESVEWKRTVDNVKLNCFRMVWGPSICSSVVVHWERTAENFCKSWQVMASRHNSKINSETFWKNLVKSE